jgi:hypothetical protein
MQRQGPEEFLGKGSVKCADFLILKGSRKIEIRPIGNINCNLGQGLIHGNSAEAVTAYTAQVTQGGLECLPKADAEVFNGMMVIYLNIACTFNVEIKKTVYTKKCQHVIHEGNTASYGSGPESVKFQIHPDICFLGLAVYFPDPGCIAHERFSSIENSSTFFMPE